MIVFTKPGDTIGRICYRVTGRHSKLLIEKTTQLNLRSYAKKNAPSHHNLVPYHPIWVPMNDNICARTRDKIIRQFDRLPSYQRVRLAQAQHAGMCVDTLVIQHDLLHIANAPEQEKTIEKKESAVLASIEMVHLVTDEFTGVLKRELEDFKQLIKNLRNTLSMASKVEEDSPEQAALFKEYKALYRKLNKSHNFIVRHFTDEQRILKRPERAIKYAKRFGWEIYDEWSAAKVIKSSRVLERVEKGLMFLSVGIGGYETAEAYAHGENWQREGVIQGGKILGDTVFGKPIMNLSKKLTESLLAKTSEVLFAEEVVGTTALFLTPLGWLAAAAFTAYSLYELNELCEHLVKEYWRD